MDIPCFYAVPIAKVQVELRRFKFSIYDESKKLVIECPGPMVYHDAEITLGIKDKLIPPSYEDLIPCIDHKDPRWPKKCVCGYEFEDKDEWQTNEHRTCGTPGGWVERDQSIPH